MNSAHRRRRLILLTAVCQKYRRIYRKGGSRFRKMRRKLICCYLLLKRWKNRSSRHFWVRPIFEKEARLKYGASDNLIKAMRDNDRDRFINYFRMTPEQFEKILGVVEQQIKKEDTRFRQAIPARTRLEITLRYLADGCSMSTLQYQFRVGKQSVSKIISETCTAIWDGLAEQVFPKPVEETWKQTSQEFEERWNFSHCLGAIDGKHINIQAPPNSGSVYYNYKGNHSIVLLAIAKADYSFSMVDVGFPGRQSDSGIFNSCPIGAGFRNNQFNIPPPAIPSDNFNEPLPYVLVGDEAFGLTDFLMRPYPRRGILSYQKKVFNYRLSRARRVVESAFGIFAGRWRLFRRSIIASEETVIKCVQAAVCLHNFLIMDNKTAANQNRHCPNVIAEEQQILSTNNNLTAVTRMGSNMFSQSAAKTRDLFTLFFNTAGAVPFQREKLHYPGVNDNCLCLLSSRRKSQLSFTQGLKGLNSPLINSSCFF